MGYLMMISQDPYPTASPDGRHQRWQDGRHFPAPSLAATVRDSSSARHLQRSTQSFMAAEVQQHEQGDHDAVAAHRLDQDDRGVAAAYEESSTVAAESCTLSEPR